MLQPPRVIDLFLLQTPAAACNEKCLLKLTLKLLSETLGLNLDAY